MSAYVEENITNLIFLNRVASNYKHYSGAQKHEVQTLGKEWISYSHNAEVYLGDGLY